MAKHVVDEIPSKFTGEADDGFWKSSTRDAYISAYNELVDLGVPPERAFEFLGDLYSATAGEFGG